MASRMLKKDLDSLAGKYNFALDLIAKNLVLIQMKCEQKTGSTIYIYSASL